MYQQKHGEALTAAEEELKEAIDSYSLDKANTEKQHQQAVEDLATTTKDRDAIVASADELSFVGVFNG